MRTRALAIGEISLEQGLLQRLLFTGTLQLGPVQQAMRIKSVVDAAASTAGLIRHAELEAELGTACRDVFAVRMRLLRREAVFLRDLLGNLLALRPHLGADL